MNILLRTLAIATLSMLSLQGGAADHDDTVLLLGVDVIQLNNRMEPNGYAAVMTEFKVKNITTGKRYSSRVVSYGRPAVINLPAGAYCFYSVSLSFNQQLDYCKEPTFDVKGGKINNAGYWRFGVSYDTGAYKLMHAFKHPEEVTEQAKKHYPELFSVSDPAGQ